MNEDEILIAPGDRQIVEETDFGRLVWMISGAQGNSATMTVGRCHIAPGRSNPRHYHPNCDEVLYLVAGRIVHSVGDRKVAMAPGDAINVPAGIMHNAENVGDEEAVCVISYSSADRQVVGE